MEHNFFKTHYIICKICGDVLELMDFIDDYIEDNRAEYLEWLEDERDDNWYRCDFVSADGGIDFEKWLEEKCSDYKLIERDS